MEENETGIVKELLNNRMLVECDAVSMCCGCSEKNGCTMSSEGKARLLWMKNYSGAVPGDIIMFRIEKKGIVYASLILYLFPLILLFAGMIAGYKLNNLLESEIDSDLSSIIGGIIGLILSAACIKIFSVLTAKKEIFEPIPLRIINKS